MDLDDVAHTIPLWIPYAATALGFAVMYVALAGAGTLVAAALVRAGRARPVDARGAAPGQGRREALRALPAIAAFSLWTPILLALFRAGVVHLSFDAAPASVLYEVLGVLAFNEVHFLAVHALLHTRWLYRPVHALHHRATVPTPFSTYALHPVEALLLGSVLPIAALFVPLHVGTLFLFPAVHLALNVVGHLGVARSSTSIAARHGRHHRTARGELGFILG